MCKLFLKLKKVSLEFLQKTLLLEYFSNRGHKNVKFSLHSSFTMLSTKILKNWFWLFLWKIYFFAFLKIIKIYSFLSSGNLFFSNLSIHLVLIIIFMQTKLKKNRFRRYAVSLSYQIEKILVEKIKFKIKLLLIFSSNYWDSLLIFG